MSPPGTPPTPPTPTHSPSLRSLGGRKRGSAEGRGLLHTGHQTCRSKRPHSWGGHPCGPDAFSPQDCPTRKSLSEGNQPGSAGRWWDRQLGLGHGRWALEEPRGSRPPPCSCPRPPSSGGGETGSPGAARGRREPGTGWGRGGRSEGTQSRRRILRGAPGMRAGFWRFLDRPPGWVRVFCPRQEPRPTQSQADGPTLPPSC